MLRNLLSLSFLFILFSCSKNNQSNEILKEKFVGSLWELKEIYHRDSAMQIGMSDSGWVLPKVYLAFSEDGSMRRILTVNHDYNHTFQLLDFTTNYTALPEAFKDLETIKRVYTWTMDHTLSVNIVGLLKNESDATRQFKRTVGMMKSENELVLETKLNSNLFFIKPYNEILRSDIVKEIYVPAQSIEGARLKIPYDEDY